MSDEVAAQSASGSSAAAVLAAGIGCFALGVLALAGDAFPALARALTFWTPTGPLSGVTDLAILIWLLSWLALSRLWARRDLRLAPINLTAAVLFIAGLLLTFPPFMDLLQGK